jgi:hypothetical protein
MLEKRSLTIIHILLMAAILIACSLFTAPTETSTLIPPTLTPTRTNTPSPTLTFTTSPTSTPTATPLPTIIPPEPPTGPKSNVYGRVIRRGKPVKGIKVWLHNYDAESRTEFYSEYAATDGTGTFYFSGVPEGNFTLKAERVGGYEYTFSVPSSTNFNFGEYRLIDTNLLLESPQHESILTDTPDSLQWQPYPGAAYYRVLLLQTYGSYTNIEMRTEETQLILPQPLMSCEYIWVVTAFDEAGMPLASSTGDSSKSNTELAFSKNNNFAGATEETQRFTIENDMLPGCHIATSIKDEGSRVVFNWELHPLAVGYRLYVTRSSGSLYAGTHRSEVFYDGSFDVDQGGNPKISSLPSFVHGYYYNWYIYAIAHDGGILAAGTKSFDTR